MTMISENALLPFVTESNRIEGILRSPTHEEVQAHLVFLMQDEIEVSDLEKFVAVVAPGKLLRSEPGMNVRVGSHFPPPGGPDVVADLKRVLRRANLALKPYGCHQDYETLHPFMDGNGRSGRVLWLWQMVNQDHELSDYALRLGFLHTWYYQSLGDPR